MRLTEHKEEQCVITQQSCPCVSEDAEEFRIIGDFLGVVD
jgi:hypothetical protein